MKNTLKLIIESIRIAMDKVIDKIPQPDWNQNDESAKDYVKNKPFGEEVDKNILVPEQTLENFEAMQDSIYVVVNQFTMTPIVGDTYTVNWDGNSYDVVVKELDGLIYIGNENYANITSGGDIPFAIIFTGADIFVAIESTETSYAEETHIISIFTTQTTVKKIDKKYLPDMGAKSWNDLEDKPFGEEIKFTEALPNTVVNEDYTLLPDGIYTLGKKYIIEINGEQEELELVSAYVSAFGKHKIGFNIKSGNQGAIVEDSSKKFILKSNDYYNDLSDIINASVQLELSCVHENDITFPATIRIFESEPKTVMNYLDPKFVKDMYYEEKDYTVVLSYTPSTFSDDRLSYNCTADEIASFRELLDNNSEITVGIGETLYTLEFRGMSSGYYELYYNDSLVFEYYVGNSSRQINFYYKNLGLSSTPEEIEITFYKQDTLIHKIDEKYLPDDIGGASVFTVNITVNEDGSYSADKTFDEIKAAHESGKVVMSSYMDAIFPCASITEEDILFAYASVYEAGVCGEAFYMLQDNTIGYIREDKLIGNINNLTTEDKSIVGAINELNAKHTEGTESLTLLSPNGTRFSITVGDDGVLSANEIII